MLLLRSAQIDSRPVWTVWQVGATMHYYSSTHGKDLSIARRPGSRTRPQSNNRACGYGRILRCTLASTESSPSTHGPRQSVEVLLNPDLKGKPFGVRYTFVFLPWSPNQETLRLEVVSYQRPATRLGNSV